VCDETIDLSDKNVLMFSYGSGCAASMFVLRFNRDYRRIQRLSDYRPRLARRVRISPSEYDQWMSLREASFGKANVVPKASIEHLEEGTYYLTRIDEKFIRYYAIKGSADQTVPEEGGTCNPTLPRTSPAAQRLQALDTQFEEQGRQKNAPNHTSSGLQKPLSTATQEAAAQPRL